MGRNKSQRRTSSRAAARRGVTVVLFAMTLIVLMALVALSVDVGYLCAVRTDLQIAADSGALAGSGRILDSESDAIASAERFAQMNLNNQGVRVGSRNNIDVQLGHWNMASRSFIPGGTPRDAVQVTTTAQDSPLFFGKAFGRHLVASHARAVAAYRPRDIMLVLDVSGSMNESRRGIRKIDELRDAITAFLGYIRQANGRDRVGFSYYSTSADLGKGLSYDLKAVEKSLMERLTPNGWTNISDGMLLAREEMNRNRRAQAAPLMVVLTDGAANTIQPENIHDVSEAKRRVLEQAELANRDGIPMFTMALDSLTAEVDVDLMARVATITNSESLHVIAGEMSMTGNRQLREAFRRVALNRPLRLVD